jgi:hypothetical protein
MNTFLADTSIEPVRINGCPVLRMRRDGEIDAIVAMRVENGLLTGLYAVRNPEKLSRVEQETALGRRLAVLLAGTPRSAPRLVAAGRAAAGPAARSPGGAGPRRGSRRSFLPTGGSRPVARE